DRFLLVVRAAQIDISHASSHRPDMHNRQYRHIGNERLNALELAFRNFRELKAELGAAKLFSPEVLDRINLIDMLLRCPGNFSMEFDEHAKVEKLLEHESR